MSDIKAPFVPDYASYNWTGAPSNYDSLATNELGGDSSMFSIDKYPAFLVFDKTNYLTRGGEREQVVSIR